MSHLEPAASTADAIPAASATCEPLAAEKGAARAASRSLVNPGEATEGLSPEV